MKSLRLSSSCTLTPFSRDWKPGTLKDNGKRAGAEKGFRE